MSPEEIISFFVKRGHRVVQTAGCWWYDEYRQNRVYNSFPPHRLTDPTREEIGQIFRGVPAALAIRFTGPPRSRGDESFIWARRKPYDLTVLSSKSRNQTRRGIERCQVKRLSWDELLKLAGEAHSDTMKRHGTNGAESLGFDIQLSECPAYEPWGAYIDGRLAAYAVTLQVEDWVHILLHRSVTAHLKVRPNNALIFCMVKELLSSPGVSAVGYGLQPLTRLDSLEHFKLGMGFVKEPVCQHIVWAPRLKLLVNPITSRGVEALASLLPGVPRLQKIAGLCRLARNG